MKPSVWVLLDDKDVVRSVFATKDDAYHEAKTYLQIRVEEYRPTTREFPISVTINAAELVRELPVKERQEFWMVEWIGSPGYFAKGSFSSRAEAVEHMRKMSNPLAWHPVCCFREGVGL